MKHETKTFMFLNETCCLTIPLAMKTAYHALSVVNMVFTPRKYSVYRAQICGLAFLTRTPRFINRFLRQFIPRFLAVGYLCSNFAV